MKRPAKKAVLIFAVNMAAIISALFYYYFSVRHLPEVDHEQITISNWRGRNQEYRDGGFFADDEIKDSGHRSLFMWGPYKPLKKGSYTAIISYTAESDQSCYAGDKAEGGEPQHYLASDGILSRFSDSARYQFEITEDVREFQLAIEYSGMGDFGVRSISIVPNNQRAKRITTEMLAWIGIADLLVLFFRLPDEKKRTVFFIAGITALISLPLTVRGMNLGHDLEIHLLRIESIADALRSGQFPARISTLALWGLGYPFSIYYNDVFLYLPAVLRLLGFSADSAYKVYLAAVNLITVLTAYFSFSRIFRSRKTGMILTLLYSAASYRFINVYVRSAVGEYTAQAFLPLLAMAFFSIYSDTEKTKREIFRNAFLLTAAFSGILGSHVLTMIMAGFMILLVLIVLWRRTLKKETLFCLGLAAVMTLVINLYFLVPFIDYYLNVPTFINSTVGSDSQMIQNSGVFPGQLFAFFETVCGNRDNIVDGRFQATPGLVLMMVFLFAVYLRIFKIRSKRFRFLLFFSSLTLLLSTNLFPWNRLALYSSFWRMLAQIQFPWRFLVFAILFLTLLTGELIGQNALPFSEKHIVLIAALMSLWCTSSLFNSGKTVFYYDTLSLDPERTGHEYLLPGTVWESYDPVLKHSGMESAELRSRASDRAVLFCKASGQPEEHRISAPVFNYRGYHVLDSAGQELPFGSDQENHITFTLPDGYEGIVTVVFKEPLYWTVSLWISALACLFLSGYTVKKSTRRG